MNTEEMTIGVDPNAVWTLNEDILDVYGSAVDDVFEENWETLKKALEDAWKGEGVLVFEQQMESAKNTILGAVSEETQYLHSVLATAYTKYKESEAALADTLTADTAS